MLRVAHVISTRGPLGGAEGVLRALVAEGARRGIDQVVLNPFADASAGEALRNSCDPVAVRSYVVDSGADAVGARRWTRMHLDAFGPDIVHTHLWHALVVVSSLRSRTPRIRVLTHHHGDLYGVTGRRLREFIDRRAGRRFDLIVAVSEAVRAFLLEDYGYSPDDVVTIRNGWQGDPPALHPSPDPTVVCVANFRREKNHGMLLAAFRDVVRSLPGAHLVLVGDGPMRREIETSIRDLGIERNVTLTGTVESAWPHLASGHVFALASSAEPLGIAVLEAMAAGLPVVATDAGGVGELVHPGITGELVSIDDAPTMARHLLRLLSSTEERRRMGNAAREAASSHRMDATVTAYYELYGRLVERMRSHS